MFLLPARRKRISLKLSFVVWKRDQTV